MLHNIVYARDLAMFFIIDMQALFIAYMYAGLYAKSLRGFSLDANITVPPRAPRAAASHACYYCAAYHFDVISNLLYAASFIFIFVGKRLVDII